MRALLMTHARMLDTHRGVLAIPLLAIALAWVEYPDDLWWIEIARLFVVFIGSAAIAWACARVLFAPTAAEMLDALPVSPGWRWITAFLAALVPVAAFAAAVALPALASIDPAGGSGSGLRGAPTFAALVGAYAGAGHAVGLLATTLRLPLGAGHLVVVAAAVPFGLTVLTCRALAVASDPADFVAPVAAGALLAWAAGAAWTTRPHARRGIATAHWAVGAALGAIAIALLLARVRSLAAWEPAETWGVGNVGAAASSRGPRVVAQAADARSGSWLVIIDAERRATPIGRRLQTWDVSGDSILARDDADTMFVASLVDGSIRHRFTATPGADLRAAVISRDGERILALEGLLRASDAFRMTLRAADGRVVRAIRSASRTWAVLGTSEILLGTSRRAKTGEDVTTERLTWIDRTTGAILRERELPFVVGVSSDLRTLACVQWSRAAEGWLRSIVVVGASDGAPIRTLVAESLLSDEPRDRPGGAPVPPRALGTGSEDRGSGLLADSGLRRLVVRRVVPVGRRREVEIDLVDVASGALQCLIRSDDADLEALETARWLRLEDFIADRWIVVRVGPTDLRVIDIRTGERRRVAAERPSWSSEGLAAWEHAWNPELRSVMLEGRPILSLPYSGSLGLEWIDDRRLVVSEELPARIHLVDTVSGEHRMLLP